MRSIKLIALAMCCLILNSTLTAQSWSLSGNSGTSPTTNWLGTNDDQRVVFKVNNVEAATLSKFYTPGGAITGIPSYGLGIGTSTPNHTFQIVGGNGFALSYPGGTNYCFFEPDDNGGWNFGLWNGGYNQDLKIDGKSILFGTRQSNAKVGIGTTPNANALLDVAGNIFTSGKIAIGTTDMSKIGDNALAVNGTGVFTKIKVKAVSNWPDYVFEDTYKLPSLEDIDRYIRANKHLPEMPSADDIAKDGIDLGSTQTLLLKKVEELTLYVIEQHKQIEELKAQLKNLVGQSSAKKRR